MASRKLTNYLRTFRMRTYLSQDEMAFLLGCKTGMKVYRYERFNRDPGLAAILGFKVIFRVPIEVQFAGGYHKVEQKIKKRARLLAQKLNKGRPGRITAHKLKALSAIASGSRTEPAQTHEPSAKRETYPRR